MFCKVDSVSRRACLIHTDNRDREELVGLPVREVILFNKPAFHDTTRAVRGYAEEHGIRLKWRLMAFEVLESPRASTDGVWPNIEPSNLVSPLGILGPVHIDKTVSALTRHPY